MGGNTGGNTGNGNTGNSDFTYDNTGNTVTYNGETYVMLNANDNNIDYNGNTYVPVTFGEDESTITFEGRHFINPNFTNVGLESESYEHGMGNTMTFTDANGEHQQYIHVFQPYDDHNFADYHPFFEHYVRNNPGFVRPAE